MKNIAIQSHPRFQIHPLRVEFRNEDIEQNFQSHHLNRNQASLHTTLIFCSFFYLAFALTDLSVLGYTSETLLLLVARTFVAITAAIGLYIVRARPGSTNAVQLAATAAEIVGMGTFMLIVRHRPSEIPWHAMSFCIMLIVVYVFIPNRLIVSLSIALLATAVFIIVVLHTSTLRWSDMVTMSMLLLLANSFGLVAARRYHRLWRDEYRVQSLLTEQAMKDHLTGCFNRRHLHEVLLPIELERARRHNLSFSVILCDIDHFKSINDTYGHLCGDAVLRNCSAILQRSVRQQFDCVVRYGGEEFLLLLPQTDRTGAADLAERLRRALAKSPTVSSQHSIAITASFGVLAVDLTDGDSHLTEEIIIAAADKLLYRAKTEGRNNIQSDTLQDAPAI
ncbi:GGDEF domain-containing protein [Paraburkholderia kirstenboschensis]|uniref:diguanylate cyclase n=1 Tax=Paraburkholderia kirstenboschensis TaxID=1245436 RepID=A0ABZ0E8Y1_9BURK|nr:GGDEF domain-containing protein [Paraburkholderia kirstenboschensis]WOD13693.1 GGDEF domain-containing protein [Paraburkholderia kirstenboschensis]